MNMLSLDLWTDAVIDRLCQDVTQLSHAPLTKARKGLLQKQAVNRLIAAVERSRDIQHGHLLQKSIAAALSLHSRYSIRQQVSFPIFTRTENLPPRGQQDRHQAPQAVGVEYVEVDLVVFDHQTDTLTLCEVALAPDNKSHATRRHIRRTLEGAALSAPAWCRALHLPTAVVNTMMISGQDTQRQPAWLDCPCIGQDAVDEYFEVPVKMIVRTARRRFDRMIDRQLDDLELIG